MARWRRGFTVVWVWVGWGGAEGWGLRGSGGFRGFGVGLGWGGGDGVVEGDGGWRGRHALIHLNGFARVTAKGRS